MDNFFKFERKNDDFPFYNGQPQAIHAKGWMQILGFSFLGFLILTLFGIPFLPPILAVISDGLILPVFSVIGLHLAVKTNWHLLFRKIYGKDLLIVILFTVLAIIGAFILGSIADMFNVSTAANPSTITQHTNNAWSLFWMDRLENVFQLLGEEFLGILPFIAFLQLFTTHFKFSRKKAVLMALILSSIIFGLLHLPTYNWNIIQCLLLIGGIRIVLTIPYILTKNMWLTYLIHFLYDTIIFSIAFFS